MSTTTHTYTIDRHNLRNKTKDDLIQMIELYAKTNEYLHRALRDVTANAQELNGDYIKLKGGLLSERPAFAQWWRERKIP